jgi:hypothetical protein
MRKTYLVSRSDASVSSDDHDRQRDGQTSQPSWLQHGCYVKRRPRYEKGVSLSVAQLGPSFWIGQRNWHLSGYLCLLQARACGPPLCGCYVKRRPGNGSGDALLLVQLGPDFRIGCIGDHDQHLSGRLRLLQARARQMMEVAALHGHPNEDPSAMLGLMGMSRVTSSAKDVNISKK